MAAMHSAMLSNISERLSKVERRMMYSDLQGHEALRHFVSTFDEFDVQGDWAWPLRTMRDIAQKMMRTLMRYFKSQGEDSTDEEAVRACMHGVRMIVEEALRRVLLTMNEVEKMSMVSVVRTLREAEELLLRTRENEDMRAMALLETFTPENLRSMVENVRDGTLRMG